MSWVGDSPGWITAPGMEWARSLAPLERVARFVVLSRRLGEANIDPGPPPTYRAGAPGYRALTSAERVEYDCICAVMIERCEAKLPPDAGRSGGREAAAGSVGVAPV